MAGSDVRIGAAGLGIGVTGKVDAGQAARNADAGAFDSLLKRLESAKDSGVQAALSGDRSAAAPGASANQSMPKLQSASAPETPTPASRHQKPVIDKTDKLYEQCEALESFLIKNLLNGMRATVQKSGFMDEGFAGKMYEDMLYDEYAKDFTKNAGLGFAEMAYLELTGQRGKVINDKF